MTRGMKFRIYVEKHTGLFALLTFLLIIPTNFVGMSAVAAIRDTSNDYGNPVFYISIAIFFGLLFLTCLGFLITSVIYRMT